MTLRDVATYSGGRVDEGSAARVIAEIVTDSRRPSHDALFVALRGEHFDGHDHVTAAAARGAVAALVDRTTKAPIPLVVVDDTRRALGDLAAGWRTRLATTVVVVVGSNGKTTTKEMLASILRAAYGDDAACATEANFNNDIGVPITLLRLAPRHRAAAIEVGMNHPGETERLAAIARPDVALVLNAQREHQEFMASVAAVADEHALAIAALGADGVAVFPADDPFAATWRRAAGERRVVDFALVAGEAKGLAAVVGRAWPATDGTTIDLETPSGPTSVRLRAVGAHNARNATAAAAAAIAADVPLDAIRRGLEAFAAVGGRSDLRVVDALTLIDDTYNANPDSMRAAIDLLASHPAPRLLVAGDMGETGAEGPSFHREVGAHAAARGVDALHAFGEASRETADAYGPGARHFGDVDALIAATRAWVASHEPATVLVKGSRFMRMERVVAALSGDATVAESH